MSEEPEQHDRYESMSALKQSARDAFKDEWPRIMHDQKAIEEMIASISLRAVPALDAWKMRLAQEAEVYNRRPRQPAFSAVAIVAESIREIIADDLSAYAKELFITKHVRESVEGKDGK